ncbi:MAG: AraC family transcriptional regulator [Candidatus Methylacidiphilales bacterium]|nr:AraC family transcriptional regulator [Candidatus Methylacidiphilales bacterium]
MDLKQPDVAVDPARSRYATFDPRDQPARGGPRLALAGYEATLPHYVVERATFPCLGIECVVQGRGNLLLKGKAHSLRPGTVFTYGPGVAHRIESDPRRPLRKYFIDVRGRPPLAPGLCFSTTRLPLVAALLKQLILDQNERKSTPAQTHHTLGLVLDWLQPSRSEPAENASAALLSYRRARAYLEHHHHRPGGITDLAREIHLDSAYLTRLFQRYGDESPYQYLTRLRLDRAGQLLLRHPLQVQQVAQACGFTDPYHFSTCFKRHYGVSPRAFRTQGR